MTATDWRGTDAAPITGYAAAKDIYLAAGWPSVLPLKRGTKWPPPTGYTGHNGKVPSAAEMTAWASELRYRDGNLCLRLPRLPDADVIGIDVDAHGTKTGAATWAEARRRWGKLPVTAISTSRTDRVSGIRLYRVPPGTVLVDRIEFPELGCGDIEVVQFHHRYVVAWPSTHPDTGDIYRWLAEIDMSVEYGPPRIEDLPWLPQAWIDGLTQRNQKPVNGAQFDHDVLHMPSISSDRERKYALGALRKIADGFAETSSGRNDIFNEEVFNLSGFIHAGTLSEGEVVTEMIAAGRQASSRGDHPFTDSEMEATVRSALRGGAAKGTYRQAPESSYGGGGWWIDPPEPDQFDPPDRVGAAPSGNGQATQARPAGPVPSHVLSVQHLEGDFWARESLACIYDGALGLMASPWATLGYCAARALALTSPYITLPPLIGGPGSLNFFAAITDISSGGKGAAARVARLLVPLHGGVPQRNLGSGEGITGAYRVKENDEHPEGLYQSVMFTADEVETVSALGARNGSTMMPVLRSAFSGETLGFSYVTKGRDIHLNAGTYRLTLVIAVQPDMAGTLFAGEAAGTPQRFMWFPASDPRISDEIAMFDPTALSLPNFVELGRTRTVRIPDEAEKLIRSQRAKRARGDGHALDGHALYCREKFAYALAILDGRTDMTSEDWRLSGIAADVSTHVRDWVAERLAGVERDEAVHKGRLWGVQQEAADSSKQAAGDDRVARVWKWLFRKLEEAGGQMNNRELTRKVGSEDRAALKAALAKAVDMKLIKQLDDGVTWVRL